MAVILSLPVLIGLIAVALAFDFLTACMTARIRLQPSFPRAYYAHAMR